MALTMSRFKTVLTSVIALSVPLCAVSGVASADPDSTSKYLTTLEQHNISYKDPVQMVQIGTTLCHDLRHADGSPQDSREQDSELRLHRQAGECDRRQRGVGVLPGHGR